MKAMIKL